MEQYKTSAAVYLRKSQSDDRDETLEETLHKHLNMLNEFALKNNITVTCIYKEVVSGDGLFTRPEMIRLLNDVEQGLYTSVLCVDIDRLGRSSTKDSGIILETLKDNNCRIITLEKTYDLEDDVDEMTVELKTFFARQELKAIRKRLWRGQIETLKAGGHTGEPPYAYKRAWFNKMPSLEIIPEQAETVKLIYDMYVNQGYGSYTLAEHLNELGIPSSDGGKWNRTSVRMILNNPIYTGKIVWNRLKRIKKKRPEDKYKEVANPPELWIQAQGLHEAIISQELFDAAQEIRKTRSHPPSWKGIIKNPYSGLVICKKCGAPIQRQCAANGRMERLLCPTNHCSPSIKLELFDERIYSRIETELQNIKSPDNKRPHRTDTDVRHRIKTVNTQLKTIDTQRENLHDLLEQGVYSVDTFMQRQAALNSRQEELTKKLAQLKDELEAFDNIEDVSTLIPTMEDLLRDWNTLAPADKNIILKKIIRKIVYNRDGNKKDSELTTDITWNF